MDNAFRYWQLVRLDSSGRYYTQVIAQVQAWLKVSFADLISDPSATDRQLQEALLSVYQREQDYAELALLSLRCYVSHRIRNVCIQLTSQFGRVYGFTASDLFPFVLDDEGHLFPSHSPLSLSIIESYDPAKAQLNTWISQLVKNHPELNRALLERGLYRVSDWAILNDTTPEQLQRILRHYYQCSDAEVKLAVQLLTRYQVVYLEDRIRRRQAGQSGRCQIPTLDQLQQIDSQRPASVVLNQLKALATQLRQYRVHARGGNPVIYSSDEIDWERYPDQQQTIVDSDDDEIAFRDALQQASRQYLGKAITDVIQANVTRLQKRTPTKDQDYVQGLKLFHCDDLSMTQIASHIGLTTQVQVTRLLALKRLRADVRLLLISQLLQWLRTELGNYIPADRLEQIDQCLEGLLTEIIDQVIDEAASEAKNSHSRPSKSLFAYLLCQIIHQFIIWHE